MDVYPDSIFSPVSTDALPDRPRVRHAAPMLFKIGDRAEDHEGLILNLSTGGLAFMCKTVLQPDEKIWTHFQLHISDAPMTLLSRVCWIRDLSDDQEKFLIGVAFEELDPAEQGALNGFIQERLSGRSVVTTPEAPPPVQISRPVPEQAVPGQFFDIESAEHEDIATFRMAELEPESIPTLDDAGHDTISLPEPIPVQNHRRKRFIQSWVLSRPMAIALGSGVGMIALIGLLSWQTRLHRAQDSTRVAQSTKASTPSSQRIVLKPQSVTSESESAPSFEDFQWSDGADAKPNTRAKKSQVQQATLPSKPANTPARISTVDSKRASAKQTSGTPVLSASSDRDHLRIALKTTAPVQDHQTFWLEKPTRLVVDIPYRKSGFDRDEYKIEHALAQKLRVGLHPNKVRFVIETSELVDRDVAIERATKGLVLNLNRK